MHDGIQPVADLDGGRGQEERTDMARVPGCVNAREEAKDARSRRKAELVAPVPQHLHLHTLSDKVGSVERARAKRAKLIGKTNHARSE
jgi:hypothetical protein